MQGSDGVEEAVVRDDDGEQRTAEWYRQREGRLTGSSFAAAIGFGPTSRAEQWRRLTKRSFFEGNVATDWGIEHEHDACAAYQLHRKVGVEHVGFVPDRLREWLGVSPDGRVGQLGLAEFKCPYLDFYLEDGKPIVPSYYMAQVQGQLEVEDREWCDFVQWRPEATIVQRVIRDVAYWAWMEPRLAEFWAYVVGDVEPPRFKRGKKPVPPDHSSLVISTQFFLN